jgi:hypothetical protein
LAGDLNAKYPIWNSAVSDPSGEEILQLFESDKFEISVPQCPTQFSPVGNGDMLDIVVHRNIRLSNVIFSGIFVSDHLPIIFHILHHLNNLTNLQIGNCFKARPQI